MSEEIKKADQEDAEDFSAEEAEYIKRFCSDRMVRRAYQEGYKDGINDQGENKLRGWK